MAEGRKILLQLDIIGCAGSYPAPHSACSSYLVRSGMTSILFDTGNGSQTNLYSHIDPADLDAIVISHGHSDHFADLVGIYHYLKYASAPKSPISIFAPEDVFDKLKYLLKPGLLDSTIFALNPTRPNSEAVVNNISLRFFEANHPVPTLITRISDGNSTMCYGADGDVNEHLEAASDGVDLLLGESTWVERGKSFPKGLHLDARSLALLARGANVKSVVITHIAFPADKIKILEIVRQNYSGNPELAREGSVFHF